jgi:hypothetical protein
MKILCEVRPIRCTRDFLTDKEQRDETNDDDPDWSPAGLKLACDRS